jgi:hypothetical protein
MKKILIAMMMFAATVGNANAFEFDTNGDVLVQTIIAQIVKQTVGNTIESDSGNVVIHTQGVQNNGKLTKCWNSPFYDSKGNVYMRVKCL